MINEGRGEHPQALSARCMFEVAVQVMLLHEKNTSLCKRFGKVNSVIVRVKYLAVGRKTKGCFFCLCEIRTDLLCSA